MGTVYIIAIPGYLFELCLILGVYIYIYIDMEEKKHEKYTNPYEPLGLHYEPEVDRTWDFQTYSHLVTMFLICPFSVYSRMTTSTRWCPPVLFVVL